MSSTLNPSSSDVDDRPVLVSSWLTRTRLRLFAHVRQDFRHDAPRQDLPDAAGLPGAVDLPTGLSQEVRVEG